MTESRESSGNKGKSYWGGGRRAAFKVGLRWVEWKLSVLQKVDCRLGCALAREHDKLCARERRRGRGSGAGKKKGGRLASLQDQLKYTLTGLVARKSGIRSVGTKNKINGAYPELRRV